MRQPGSKNISIHWKVCEKDENGDIVKINFFPTAKNVAEFLEVKTNFIYDFVSPRKKYINDKVTFVTKSGRQKSRTGKYSSLFKKYSIQRI